MTEQYHKMDLIRFGPQPYQVVIYADTAALRYKSPQLIKRL